MARVFRELLESVLLALLMFIGLQASLQNFRVEGMSMEPTLQSGEFVMVNKLAYRLDVVSEIPLLRAWFRPPQRGDIVVFRFPQRPDREFVKRIVALPGERVEVKDGRLYINGRPLEEPWLPEGMRVERCYVCPLTVPPDHYFVLGDNRAGSNDSRHWGPVHRRYIIGRAWLVYWPPDRIRLLGLLPGSSGS